MKAPTSDAALHPATLAARWPLSKSSLVVFGIWTLVGLWTVNQQWLQGLVQGQPVRSLPFLMTLTLYEVWLWALLTPIFVWTVRAYPLEGANVWTRIAGYAVVAVLVHLADVGIDELVLPLIVGRPPPAYVQWLLSQANVNLVSGGAVMAITLAIDYQRASRARAVRTAELEAQLAQAQLDALRTQLHPHFLFNTLHAISTLMHRDAEAADRMLARLSDLLRATLNREAVHEVPLSQELAFLRGYLEIEQTRLGERLQVTFGVDPSLDDAVVPYLLLQPLVENAVRHAVARHTRVGHVQVLGRQVNGSLTLTVQDDGPGLNSRDATVQEGIGLRTTRERLARLYGSAHQFVLRDRPTGGLEVTLTVPLRRWSPGPGREEA